MTVKAHQNAVEIVPLAQGNQSIREDPGILPEFNRRNVQVQEHVSDAHLAHQGDSIRNPQTHCCLHPLARVHACSDQDENNIGKTDQS
jgi:hypothetical protein